MVTLRVHTHNKKKIKKKIYATRLQSGSSHIVNWLLSRQQPLQFGPLIIINDNLQLQCWRTASCVGCSTVAEATSLKTDESKGRRTIHLLFQKENIQQKNKTENPKRGDGKKK